MSGWNYFWDTGAGPIVGMGCHYTDIAQWGLLRDDTGPVAYEGQATWKSGVSSETPVTADCSCTYADGVKIVIRSSGAFKDRYIRFVGSEGWVQVDDQTDLVTAEPASILSAGAPPRKAGRKPATMCATGSTASSPALRRSAIPRARRPRHDDLPRGEHRTPPWRPLVEVGPAGRTLRRRPGQRHAVASDAAAVVRDLTGASQIGETMGRFNQSD